MANVGYGDAPLYGSGYGQTPGSNQNTPYGGVPPMAVPGNWAMPTGGGPSARPIMATPYMGAGDGSGNPYQVPQQGGTGPGQPGYYPWGTADPGYGGAAQQGRTTNPGSENLGHGVIATGLQYGGLSQSLADYLMSQIGTGVSPFNLSTMLPTGGMTQPGQLTAGENPLLSQLQNFFMTGQGGGVPGLGTLGQMGAGQFGGLAGGNTMQTIANQGISALPEWQAMINAQQQNIAQNQANLKEQFGAMGNLAGSPFGTAMSNYMQQTTADQNALLGQLQQQNILQGQIPAAENLLGLSSGAANQLFGGAQAMAGGLQALDQQAIQNMYQEFQRVSPQNNPMLPYIQGLATLYPPTTKTPTTWENINSTLGAISGSGFSTSGGTGITF